LGLRIKEEENNSNELQKLQGRGGSVQNGICIPLMFFSRIWKTRARRK
jgi:hypothetical protein